MGYQKFLRFQEFVKYDGTNWSEIESELSPQAVVTDIGGGSYHVEDQIHDPIDVQPGDWWEKNNWFVSGSALGDYYVSVTLGTP